ATQRKGRITDEKISYLLKRENGANLLTNNGGHSIDVLSHILGDFNELAAARNSHYTEAGIQETGMKIPKNTADQILIQETLVNGASASVHI
ncbi:gfo/Idh/MocA family oxidoreductase, partial [Bacillus paralicheniformis]|nr:gfo/Idh/MocA family oxidoreductase [Bacillus paralicheniformis]